MTASMKLKFDVAVQLTLFAACAYFLPNLLANAAHNNRTLDLPASSIGSCAFLYSSRVIPCSSNTSSIGSCAFLYSSSVIPCHIIYLTASGSNCILAAFTGLVYISKNYCSRRPFELTFKKFTASFAYYKNIIVSAHLIAFLVNEYFTPEWQRHVRDITREVVDCLHDALPVV